MDEPGRRETRDGPQPLRVVIVTPLGRGGRGGIDRLMDELRVSLRLPRFAEAEVTFLTSRGQGSQAAAPLHIARLLAALLRRRLTGRVDVVHINLSQTGSTYRKLVIGAFCRLLRLPYVLHLHGSRYRQFWDGAPKPVSRAIARMFAGSARILVLGSVWRDYVGGKVPEACERILVLPNASRDPGRRERVAGRPLHILFAGRLGERKGIVELVAALGLLKDRPWRATLAGDGDVEKTRQAVAALGLTDRVSIPGWISGEAFEALLGEADILTLPSYDENLPLSVIEAFARETPVVCTPVGAVPDIVEDGKTGLLVQPGDAAGLATALGRLLDAPDLRQSLATHARALFEERLEFVDYTGRLIAAWKTAAAHGRR
ncbi:hypothetical protein ASF49_04605 [Methylobacterium sp. Leaf104]|uniref:glycosyltransferase family 4 protein n=1 Tax=Methylobacterium TaxID=407 RepID=UPI0006F4A245|nr:MULTISPECIES: glycosyltransferase family 4 protein [Methylobacterium]KQP38296.1 hypothetical protein ASF49_04605 [Methylobacterium sp. Leaf104]MCI9880312.1 glycosyltransferase family 4 protein [Methylobacterium goesingense]